MLYQYFRLVIFVVHAISALFFLITAFNTNCTSILSRSYHSTAFRGYSGPSTRYPTVLSPPPTPCPPVTYDLVLGFDSPSKDSAWCSAMQPQELIEYTEDIQSMMIGSSWNVLLLMVMFEWITSSYALIYLEEPVMLWNSIPTPPGVHPVPFIATIWNIVLIVLLWFYRKTLLLPDNNLFLFSFLLFATIIMQNYIARPQTSQPTTQPALATASNSAVETRVGVNDPFAWRTDHFLRQRIPAQSTSMLTRRGLNALDSKAPSFGAAVQPDVPLHQPDYATALDLKGEAVAARMMEYSCSAPLLLVGLYLNFSNNAVTWTYQIIFASLAVCNGAGVVLHLIVLLLKTASPTDRPKLQWAGWLTLIASWLAFFAGFTVYMYTARHVLGFGETGVPTWVTSLLWSVLLLYTAFGIVVTVYYVPLLLYPIPEPSSQKGDRDSWFASFDSVVFWLDVLSFVAKLAVAWTIYSKGSVIDCKEFTCI